MSEHNLSWHPVFTQLLQYLWLPAWRKPGWQPHWVNVTRLLEVASFHHEAGQTDPSFPNIKQAGAGQGDQKRNKTEEILHHTYSNRKQSWIFTDRSVVSRVTKTDNYHKKREKEVTNTSRRKCFLNVKCTDNLMEFTWFCPLRVWLQKFKLQSHQHILDLLQLTCRQKDRTIT